MIVESIIMFSISCIFKSRAEIIGAPSEYTDIIYFQPNLNGKKPASRQLDRSIRKLISKLE